jgi:hydrogenase maturation protease
MAVTVVGIGQPYAGDDGAGPAVVDALRTAGLPEGVRALEMTDPADLVPLLEEDDDVIVVDAVVCGTAGHVVELDPSENDPAEPLAVSSHGVGVLQAIALARALTGGRHVARTRIVGITIERPLLPSHRLSPKVAAAVPQATAAIRAMLRR